MSMEDEEEEYVELAIKKVPRSFRVSQVVQVVDLDEDEDFEDEYYDDEEEYEPESLPPVPQSLPPPQSQPPPRQQPQYVPPSFAKPNIPLQHSASNLPKPLPQPFGGPNMPSPGSLKSPGFRKLPPIEPPQAPTLSSTGPRLLPKGTPPGKPLPVAPGKRGPLPTSPAPTPGARKLPTPAPKPGYPQLNQSAPSFSSSQSAIQSNISAMQERMGAFSVSSPALPPKTSLAQSSPSHVSPIQMSPIQSSPVLKDSTSDVEEGEAGDRSSFVVMNSTTASFTEGKRFSVTEQPAIIARRGTTSRLPEGRDTGKRYGAEVKEGIVDDPTKARTTVSVNNPVEDVLKREDADEHVLAKGWLLKKGRRVKNWKKRWFVLKGPKLYYYKKANDESSKKGIVHLESCIIENLKPRPDSRRPCMALLVQGRKLLIVGERDDENRYWYLVLECKKSELTYKRKRRLQNLPEDLALIDFLRNPLVRRLALDEEEMPLEAVVALSIPIRAHTELQMVSLRYAKLGSLELEVICEAICQNKSIEVLHLEGNRIDAGGAKCIAKLITSTQTIRELYLDDNRLGDEGVKLIAAAVPYSQRQMQVLTFHKNNLGPAGVTTLCQMYANTDFFSTLPVSENPFGDDGVASIANMINQNRSLTTLELENCSIGERGFSVLASALNKNETIKEIRLKGNNLDDSARKQMAQTLMVNKTLTMIDLGTYKLDADQLSAMRLLYDCGFLQGQNNLPPGANIPPILKQFH